MSAVLTKPATDAHQVGISGWSAELNCLFEPGPERTIVRRTHKGPLYMQRPFYPEGSIAHVYILHPPGGVVAGDKLSISVSCIDGGKGLVATPGATKFYRSDGGFATVNQHLETKGGSLEWLPAENIFYAQSKVKLSTTISVSGDDNLVWWEINCFGRQSCLERYAYGSISSTVSLFIDKTLTLREHLLVDNRRPLELSCGMRSNRVTGTMLFARIHKHCIDQVRNILAASVGFTATWLDDVLIVRYLGDSAEDAKLGFSNVWKELRPTRDSSPAVAPRIWAT